MSATSATDTSLTALQGDIAALKSDVASLLKHLQQGATAGAQTTAATVDHATRDLYHNLSETGVRSAKVLGAKIEAQPLAALLLAAGIGYIGGRLLSR
jgi:ElaB/YqjD/DUF883 family membrane-anchored ribosome-binding protein